MELYGGLRLIDTPFEETRQVNVWLFTGKRRLLVDTGVAGCPTATILPHLAELGIDATDLDMVINLHAHADHIGGNGEVFAASMESLRFGAHEVDAPGIEDHRLLATRVYGLTEPEQIRKLVARCGANVPVSQRFRGGEVIDLGGLVLQIIHAPGHTAGNISIYDPANRALVHGESVMGGSQQDADGAWTAPFGVAPHAYGDALRRLAEIPFELFLSSHRPPADGVAGRAEIAASLESLERFERTVRGALAQGVPDVATLAEAVAADGPYHPWPWFPKQIEALVSHWVQEGTAVRRGDGSLAAKA